MVIDKGTADEEDLGVGDTIQVAGRGPAAPYKIVGVARYGTVNSLGGATIGVFDVPVAQALLDKPGRFDTIFVAAESGVSPKELVASSSRSSAPPRSVRTGAAEGRRRLGGHRGGDVASSSTSCSRSA